MITEKYYFTLIEFHIIFNISILHKYRFDNCERRIVKVGQLFIVPYTESNGSSQQLHVLLFKVQSWYENRGTNVSQSGNSV